MADVVGAMVPAGGMPQLKHSSLTFPELARLRPNSLTHVQSKGNANWFIRTQMTSVLESGDILVHEVEKMERVEASGPR